MRLSASDLPRSAEKSSFCGAIQAARVVRCVLDELARRAHPGTTTRALEQYARERLRALRATPSFPDYRGFPAVLWASPNEFIHALPDERPLQRGDLLKLDLGAIVGGWHADLADTIVIGGGEVHLHLVSAAWAILEAAASAARPGHRVGKIGFSAMQTADRLKCNLVPGYLGHGIGRAMHERPLIPLGWDAADGPRLEAGMILAIEPVVTLGSVRTEGTGDGWSIRNEDRSPVAMFERMIFVSEAGPVII